MTVVRLTVIHTAKPIKILSVTQTFFIGHTPMMLFNALSVVVFREWRELNYRGRALGS